MNFQKIFAAFALCFALSPLAASAHAIDIIKGELKDSGSDQVQIEVQLNLWAVLLDLPVSRLTADFYRTPIDAQQNKAVLEKLGGEILFTDSQQQKIQPTISVRYNETSPDTHETPVLFTVPHTSGLKIKTAANFGTLILVTPAGQILIPPGSESLPLRLENGGLSVFIQYVKLGFEHILPKGFDHVLFVLSLFLLAPALRPLIFQVSAFTVAHTISLALSTLQIVSIPTSIVEPLIAVSIAYTAIENIFIGRMRRSRIWLVFAFGLLHGLGFAGVLGELGLPKDAFAESLIGFNIGVEFGQVAVLLLAFLCVGWLRNKAWYRSRIAIPASALIALAGLYWAVERTLG